MRLLRSPMLTSLAISPARDAAELEEAANQANGPGGQKYPEAAGRAEFPGAHSAGGYAGGGPTSAKQETSSGDSIYQTSGSGSAGGNDPTGGSGSAPDTGSTGGNSDSSNQKYPAPPPLPPPPATSPPSSPIPAKTSPKAASMSNDSNNASFTSELGSENDPGRKAERDFQTQAQSAKGGGRDRGSMVRRGMPGRVLDSDQSIVKEGFFWVIAKNDRKWIRLWKNSSTHCKKKLRRELNGR